MLITNSSSSCFRNIQLLLQVISHFSLYSVLLLYIQRRSFVCFYLNKVIRSTTGNLKKLTQFLADTQTSYLTKFQSLTTQGNQFTCWQNKISFFNLSLEQRSHSKQGSITLQHQFLTHLGPLPKSEKSHHATTPHLCFSHFCCINEVQNVKLKNYPVFACTLKTKLKTF